MTEPYTAIADCLCVHSSTTDGAGWQRWVLVHNPEGPHSYTMGRTYVIRGPANLIVTGDMASMIFERSGGFSLSFGRCTFTYVAEKCRAGEPWEYSPSEARADVEKMLQDLKAEFGADSRKVLEVEEGIDLIDFNDEAEVNTCLYDLFDEPTHVGRAPSSEIIRALACIEAVYRSEISRLECV